jgi:hypothetical protein
MLLVQARQLSQPEAHMIGEGKFLHLVSRKMKF